MYIYLLHLLRKLKLVYFQVPFKIPHQKYCRLLVMVKIYLTVASVA